MQSAEEIHQNHCAYARYLSRGKIFPIHQEWAKDIIRAKNKNIRILNEKISTLAEEQIIQQLINSTPATVFINDKRTTIYAYEWHTDNEQYLIQLTENNNSTQSMNTIINISHWNDAINYAYSDKGIVKTTKKINQHTFNIHIHHHMHSYGNIDDVEHIMQHLTTPPQPALYDALKKIYDQYPTLEIRRHIARHLPYQHSINASKQAHEHISTPIFPARGSITPIDQEISRTISPLSQHQTIQLCHKINHIVHAYQTKNTELFPNAPHSAECTSTTQRITA